MLHPILLLSSFTFSEDRHCINSPLAWGKLLNVLNDKWECGVDKFEGNKSTLSLFEKRKRTEHHRFVYHLYKKLTAKSNIMLTLPGIYSNFNRDGCGIIQIYLLKRGIVKFPTVEINSAFVSSCWGIIKIWEAKSERCTRIICLGCIFESGQIEILTPLRY